MKGVLLAGGRGTRLWPITASISKQMVPIYDKPMIYYSLTTLMLAGVTEIAIITNPEHESLYRQLLGDGNRWGLTFHFILQEAPTGIPDVLKLVPKSYKEESVMLVLGDNFLYGMGLGASLKSVFSGTGAKVFSYKVVNPSDYGVIEVDHNGYATGIEEKPLVPKSQLAIPGVYFLDKFAFDYVKELQPSTRGETEITDLLRIYLEKGELTVQQLARGTAWLDTGTWDNLLEASEFVRALEKRQGLKIGCPEEVSLRMGFINENDFKSMIESFPPGEYKNYLMDLPGS